MNESDQPVQITSEIGPWAMVPIWVLDKKLSGGELATYVALRSFADRTNNARPYTRTIALRANVSQRTAERAIDRLRELGMIITQRKHRPDGSIAGLSFHLVDRDPGSYGARAVSVPPVTGVGTPPVTGDGTLPSRVTEQEHTSEHTSKNTPGKQEPARASDVGTPLAVAPSVRPSGSTPTEDELRADEEVRRESGSRRTSMLVAQVLEANRGRLSIAPDSLGRLLRTAMDNSVPPWVIRRAVTAVLEAGDDLAPWTLQKAVAKVTKPAPRSGWSYVEGQ